MEQMISDFLYDTCRVNPKPNLHKFYALYYCNNCASLPHDDGDYSRIVTSSGSASEFYIEPMLSCISDYDVMHQRNDVFAIPKGHSVPRCLPAEFHHHVTVYQLTDTEFPAYVTVESNCQLIKSNNDDYYECFPTGKCYGTATVPDNLVQHGPATQMLNAVPATRMYKFSDGDSSRLPVDAVFCIRCLVWPPQAADWPTRRRERGWPDLTTVKRIVNSGCDVVQVSHPQCRQDERMRECQWRLSFSRAETVLLNSWSVKQQIVYHLLRIFIKTGRHKDTSGTQPVNNYIIKTVMLWTCELHSATKWNSSNLINICRILIRRIITCFKSSTCRSFFVTRLNLLSNLENTDELKHDVKKLMNVTNESLCLWLIDNYIRQCVEQCPHYHNLRRFCDNPTTQVLPRALSITSTCRRSRIDDISCTDFTTACWNLQDLIFNTYLPAESNRSSCKYITEHLHAIDSRLLPLYYATYSLKVSSLLDRGQSALQMADAIITLIQSSACVFSRDDSKLVERLNDETSKQVLVASSGSQSLTVCKNFRSASVLMLTTRLARHKFSSLSRLFMEMSKVYLHAALQCTKMECRDFHNTSHSMISILLSCLYYTTKQSNIAFIHCDNVISSLKKRRIQLCHIERQLLPCFGKTVETILGSILFYQYLLCLYRDHPQRDQRVDVFTVDLFGFYLVNVYSGENCSAMFCRSRREMYSRYKIYLMKKRELTLGDFLLFHDIYRETYFSGKRKMLLCSVSHNFRKCKRYNVTVESARLIKTRLSRLLVQSAVEHLTAFRVSQSRDFSSVRHIVTNDFQAMYAYKCRLYEECFYLCEKKFYWLQHVDIGATIYVFRVMKSDLLHLVDDECLSLIGLTKLCGIFDINPRETECVNQLTLLMYLLIQSKLQLMHSAASIIEALRRVIIVHQRHDPTMTVNRAMMIFVYRKAVRHLQSLIV
jgi:hypothetical protein